MRMRAYILKHILLLLAIFILAPVVCSSAQEKLELTLDEAVGIALRKNLTVAEQNLLVRKGEAEIKVWEGEFDPAIELLAERAFEKESVPSDILSAEEHLFNYEASLGGKLRTGTEYELVYAGGKVRSSDTLFLNINPYYSSDLALSFSQPLLKGFGKSVQESNITVAKTELEIARLNAEHKSMEIIADTVSAYWELYFRKNELDVAGLSLKLAENTLEEVKTKIEAGALASVEIYGAEAEVAVRDEKLIQARKAVSDAEDALREVVNLGDWQSDIIPVEALPEPEDVPMLGGLLEDAFKNRRDYKQALREYENRKVLSSFYRNQRLPGLDLIGSIGLNGLSGSYGDALDDTYSGEFYSWGVGVSVSIPLGNRTAEGNYIKARRDEDIAEIDVERVKQAIMIEVREAHRALELSRESIEANRRKRIASEKRLRAEEERFRLGMATLNDVLEFQESYALALSSEQKALTDYARSETNIKKVTGILLP
jgi:outer membrane protein TolC